MWFGLGYPIARILGLVNWPALAAPPLGLAIYGVILPILYLRGIPASQACLISLTLAAPGILLATWDGLRHQWSRIHLFVLGAAFTAGTLIILPKWAAVPDFSVFQGNIGDQFWYLTNAFIMSRFDAGAIQRLEDGIIEMGFSLPRLQHALDRRPCAALMLSSFSSVLQRPILLSSYAYLASLQLCLFFATAFVVRNLFHLSKFLVLLLAIGLTISFYTQYAFDINSWSHLASISLSTLMIGLFVMQFTERSGHIAILSIRGAFLAMTACIAGLVYIYPETLPTQGALLIAMTLYLLVNTTSRTYFLRRFAPFLASGVIALLLCLLSWKMIFGILVYASGFVFDPTYTSSTTDWWKYADAYLFGYDNDPRFPWGPQTDLSLFELAPRILSLAPSFLAGGLGIYYLQPHLYIAGQLFVGAVAILCTVCLAVFWHRVVHGASKVESGVELRLLGGRLSGLFALGLVFLFGCSWLVSADPLIPVYIRVLWKGILFVCLIALILSWVRTIYRPRQSHEVRSDRILFAGTIGGLLFVGLFVLSGHYWAAGEGLIMLSPILFIAIVATILSDHEANKVAVGLALLYLIAQLGFGAYRTYAAISNPYGIHYSPPYPTDMRKQWTIWDYGRLRGEISNCASVSIDIDDLFLETFVKLVATDVGLRWSSTRPAWGRDGAMIQKQLADPECIVSTKARSIEKKRKLVWLRRDLRLLGFYGGASDQFDIVPAVPWELPAVGLSVEESWFTGYVWADGQASLQIPNNPDAPASKLSIVVDPNHVSDAQVVISVNGQTIVADILPSGTAWRKTVDLTNFANSAWLDIRIESDTSPSLGMPRTRLIRINRLTLYRESRKL